MSSVKTIYKRRYRTSLDDVDSDVFARVQGRLFERWIEYNQGNARTTGFFVSNMVQQPPYMIESLLRDELLVERDLVISTATDTTHVIVNGLLSSEDDYYNYAIYYNVTTNHKTYVSDYTGSTKTLTLAAADTSVAADDNIYLTNIRGDYQIDITSFDIVGNNSDGLRKGWIFARAYTKKESVWNLISELCFESHCELIESINPSTGEVLYKLKAIDTGSSDTWTNPSYIEGLEQAVSYLTPLGTVYTKFRLRYHYDQGKGDFIKEIYVDKNGYPTSATILGDTEKNLCKYAEQTYQIENLREFKSYNIYRLDVAERYLQKKIGWFTKQRLVVRYLTPIAGTSDWIKYEVGDQVKLNFSKSIPTGLNNSSMFMITNKAIRPAVAGGTIQWELIEL